MAMERRMMTYVSKLYYEDNLTQQQIAKKTNLSRMKVSRLLQKAREVGVVQIIIDYSGVYPELEASIEKKYKLEHAIVVDTSLGSSKKEQVAAAAAYYLERTLRQGVNVAVGWGTTIQKIPEHIKENDSLTNTFLPIIGGHGQSELAMHASMIAADFAKKSKGESQALIAPALVSSEEEKQILMRNQQIKNIIEETAAAEYAVFSLGNPTIEGSSIRKSGYISREDFEQLGQEDTVCDVVSIVYLNRNSEECCQNITRRCIGITSEQLKKIPNKICVVVGSEKFESVRTALEAGYIDVLITDQETAQYLDNYMSMVEY